MTKWVWTQRAKAIGEFLLLVSLTLSGVLLLMLIQQ